jgi:hypothetical protein
LTPEQKAQIDVMTREDLAYEWRFGPSEFWGTEAGRYACERFWHHFGGFTPAISKKIGWDIPEEANHDS